MTEVRMKNLFRMHIHPNRMAAIRDSQVKQLFLNAKPRRLEFFNFEFLIIAAPSCNLTFYYKLAEVPGVTRGILKIKLKKSL